MEKEEWDKDKNKMISTGENEKLIVQLHYGLVQRIKLKKTSMKIFISPYLMTPKAHLSTFMQGRRKHGYTQLLYIPKKPLLICGIEREKMHKLYIKRVFIMDDADNLLPSYLRFVKGVVGTMTYP